MLHFGRDGKYFQGLSFDQIVASAIATVRFDSKSRVGRVKSLLSPMSSVEEVAWADPGLLQATLINE